MKNVLLTIGNCFVKLLGIVLLVIVGFGFLLYLPFDYVKYKASLYYKTFHKKYKLFAGLGTNFDVYNVILKNQLPIEYIENPACDGLSHGGLFTTKP